MNRRGPLDAWADAALTALDLAQLDAEQLTDDDAAARHAHQLRLRRAILSAWLDAMHRGDDETGAHAERAMRRTLISHDDERARHLAADTTR